MRIKKGWVFDTRDGRGITYREFAVLCAIYSAIGDKELAIVTRERGRYRALGYRTTAIMQAELPNRADKAQPLTERRFVMPLQPLPQQVLCPLHRSSPHHVLLDSPGQ